MSHAKAASDNAQSTSSCRQFSELFCHVSLVNYAGIEDITLLSVAGWIRGRTSTTSNTHQLQVPAAIRDLVRLDFDVTFLLSSLSSLSPT